MPQKKYPSLKNREWILYYFDKNSEDHILANNEHVHLGGHQQWQYVGNLVDSNYHYYYTPITVSTNKPLDFPPEKKIQSAFNLLKYRKKKSDSGSEPDDIYKLNKDGTLVHFPKKPRKIFNSDGSIDIILKDNKILKIPKFGITYKLLDEKMSSFDITIDFRKWFLDFTIPKILPYLVAVIIKALKNNSWSNTESYHKKATYESKSKNMQEDFLKLKDFLESLPSYFSLCDLYRMCQNRGINPNEVSDILLRGGTGLGFTTGTTNLKSPAVDFEGIESCSLKKINARDIQSELNLKNVEIVEFKYKYEAKLSVLHNYFKEDGYQGTISSQVNYNDNEFFCDVCYNIYNVNSPSI
ncbi:MAG: hypothetical protein ACTSPQ_20270 [Candidatus Helarchaeota archaeon]